MSMYTVIHILFFFFFFQAEDGIRDLTVTGVQTCALPIFPLLRGNRDSRRFFHTAWTLSRPLRRRLRSSGGIEGAADLLARRSEERRVGKSVDLGGRRIIKKKKKKTEK